MLLLSGRATVAEIVLLQAARGTAEAFFRPAITGLVPQTLAAARLQQGNALINLSQSLGHDRRIGARRPDRGRAGARAGRSPSGP